MCSYNVSLVDNSARMPQGNGSIIGSGVPSVILLIIAIETRDEDDTPCIAINPQKVKIKNATVG